MTADLAQSYDGRRVCVTGGAGFIGSHLCDALVGRGAVVTVIDDFSNGRRENLQAIADQVRVVEGSILDEDALAEACADASVIFHQAAVTSVPNSVNDPARYHQVNATGSLRVLEAARTSNVQRVVMASSSSVYGDQPVSPKVETMCPDPLSPYAAAKAAAEQIARAYACCYDQQCVSLRYFNIFGPRQRPDSAYAAVIPRFIVALNKGQQPTIFGDGLQTRDFTFVANAVHANLLAGTVDADLRGTVLNIATGKGRTVLEMLQSIGRLLNVEPHYTIAPPRMGEILHSRADISLAQSMLGYKPVTTFDDGLAQTVQSYV